MKKENRKAAQERRAKEREHEAKVAHRKKVWSYAGPMLIILVIVVLIIASVMDSKRLSSESASDDTSSSSTVSASSASTSASASLQTDTSLTIEDGDTVNIDYIGSIDGVEFQGGNTKGNGADLVIGSHSYIDDFEDQLIGHHPGDSVDVTVTFPEDYGKEELNGKEALFKVTINGIYK